MHHFLQCLCDSNQVDLHMHEWDISRDPTHDILNSEVAEKIFQAVQDMKPDVVLCTPPCNTYSRARHNYERNPGPRPIRDATYPQGFPWLSDRNKRLADEANALVEFTWILFELCASLSLAFLGEHPEDLGMTRNGRPASIWQSKEFSQCLQHPHAWTFAIFQCLFGAETSKPTRFVTTLKHFMGPLHKGIPTFSKSGHYTGPLPHRCPHQHKPLAGLSDTGEWNTSPAASYPPGLCKAIAESIFAHFQSSSAVEGVGASEGLEVGNTNFGACVDGTNLEGDASGACSDSANLEVEITTETNGNDNESQGLHWSELTTGCIGPPLAASLHGKSEEFVDGFGKCSPGRWGPNSRSLDVEPGSMVLAIQLRNLLDNFCKKELKDLARSTFMLATGKLARSPFSDKSMDDLRKGWFALLPDPTQAAVKPDFQPFFLNALSQTMQALGDPDWQVLCTSPGANYAEGVPVGHLEEISNVPQVFARRSKAVSYDQSDIRYIMDNYKTAQGNLKEILEEQFAEEERAGRMFPLSVPEAKRRYPGDQLRVAAQGALEKPGGGHRVIHDATHGVNLNNQIVSDNQMVNPGPREMATVLNFSAKASQRVLFGVAADISKAHRLFRYCEDQWGVLGCRTHDDAEVIWFNRTGTFGVASAAFWWSRLAGFMGRLAFRLSLQDWLFILIFVDDMLVTAGGSNRWLVIWRVIACFEMCGAPFGYHKFKGGLQLDYVGFWLDYAKFSLGVSERRSNWIIRFVEEMQASHWLVDVRRFHEFQGRLGFMSQALVWIKPFLSAGYAWISVVRKGGVLAAPPLVQFACNLIKEKLKIGYRVCDCERQESDIGEIFRTDAKCERHKVVLGGWLVWKGLRPFDAPWFSIPIAEDECPWLFDDTGESSWASTTAELLASVVALILFDPIIQADRGPKVHKLVVHGGVDNKSTSHLTRKAISTKTPLLGVLMEYLHQSEARDMRCILDWRPRSVNAIADQLTNSNFEGFDFSKRITASWDQLDLPVLKGCAHLMCTFKESIKLRMSGGERPPKFIKSTWE